MKQLLLVGSFDANAVIHLGLARYKWKNVMSEFAGLFAESLRELKKCEYLNAKVRLSAASVHCRYCP